MIDKRILICAAVSVVGHFAVARGLDELPPYAIAAPREPVTIRVIPAPPPPEPPPAPEPPPPPPPKVQEMPKPRTPPKIVREAPVPTPVEPPPVAATLPATGDPTAKPKFGVSMSSTSQGGSTSMPTGNTTAPTAPTGPATEAKPLAVAAAADVTKMPLPQGRCAGKYTDAARDAALEGVVVLDVIVDETGKTRDIQVVEGLAHGLTEAAIAALRACRFTPGERAGAPVAVRIRGFKIRFVLGDATSP